MNIFDAIDQADKAISKIQILLRRPKGLAPLKKHIDLYVQATDQIVKIRSMNTYFDLLSKASSVLYEDITQHKLSTEEWIYYLEHMPVYSRAIGQLVSNDHSFNKHIVNATLKWETRTDPFIDLDLAMGLLSHNDHANWVAYIMDRRHDNASIMTGLVSLGAITSRPEKDSEIIAAIKSMTSIIDIGKTKFWGWSRLLCVPQIDKIYQILDYVGSKDIIPQLIAHEQNLGNEESLFRFYLLQKNYSYRLDQAFTDELLKNNNAKFDRKVVHAFTTENTFNFIDFFESLNEVQLVNRVFRIIEEMKNDERIDLDEARVDEFLESFVRAYKSIEKLDKDIEKFNLPMKGELKKTRAYKKLMISSDLHL